MTKLTRKPVIDQRVRFHLVARGPRDLEKDLRSINDTAVCIQCFALMFLSVCTMNFGEVISFLLGRGRYGVLVPFSRDLLLCRAMNMRDRKPVREGGVRVRMNVLESVFCM